MPISYIIELIIHQYLKGRGSIGNLKSNARNSNKSYLDTRAVLYLFPG